VKCFLPLSLSGIGRNEDTESYKGKKMKVKIMDVKERRGTIELLVSRKELAAEERKIRRKEFFETLEVDKEYNGAVKAIINVGAFVRVGEIDVFVPISELSWKRISKPQDVVSENQNVRVKLIRIDTEKMRVTGSIKQLTKEPFEEFISKNNVDDIIEGKVARFADFGVFVELKEGIDGLIHISNLSEERVNKPQDVVKQGDIVKIKIISIDNETKKVSLSLKDANKKEE
jgi:4-hydroxy-3-methylbut-2-enyl diphosphate reductase